MILGTEEDGNCCSRVSQRYRLKLTEIKHRNRCREIVMTKVAQHNWAKLTGNIQLYLISHRYAARSSWS